MGLLFSWAQKYQKSNTTAEIVNLKKPECINALTKHHASIIDDVAIRNRATRLFPGVMEELPVLVSELYYRVHCDSYVGMHWGSARMEWFKIKLREE